MAYMTNARDRRETTNEDNPRTGMQKRSMSSDQQTRTVGNAQPGGNRGPAFARRPMPPTSQGLPGRDLSPRMAFPADAANVVPGLVARQPPPQVGPGGPGGPMGPGGQGALVGPGAPGGGLPMPGGPMPGGPPMGAPMGGAGGLPMPSGGLPGLMPGGPPPMPMAGGPGPMLRGAGGPPPAMPIQGPPPWMRRLPQAQPNLPWLGMMGGMG